MLTRLTVLTADKIDIVDLIDSEEQLGHQVNPANNVNPFNDVNLVNNVRSQCRQYRQWSLCCPNPLASAVGGLSCHAARRRFFSSRRSWYIHSLLVQNTPPIAKRLTLDHETCDSFLACICCPQPFRR